MRWFREHLSPRAGWHIAGLLISVPVTIALFWLGLYRISGAMMALVLWSLVNLFRGKNDQGEDITY